MEHHGGGQVAHHLQSFDGALVYRVARSGRQLKAYLDGFEAGLQVVSKSHSLHMHTGIWHSHISDFPHGDNYIRGLSVGARRLNFEA